MISDLKKAIDQISKDKGLDRAMLIETLQEAVRTSVLRRYNDEIEVEVSYNDETGEMDVYQFKVVVPDGELDFEDTQIEYSEASKIDSSIQVNDEMGFRVKIEDLGRIAAQSAKQVIIQRMRDAEQASIYTEFKQRIGEIISGTVQRRDKGGLVISLGHFEAILPREEQIPKEHYKRGDSLQAIIIDVHKEGRGPQIVLSRSHRDYMSALFRREIPEVDDGVIQIMGVARDPGSRAKVSVFSREREIDAVGACVGVRGSRIQNIVQELHGERIDIVVWHSDIATYAKNALAPALVSRIMLDEDNSLLEVIVPDEQLTNAIGRKGQNVKLAARLLGWKIDIFTESRYSEQGKIGRGLEQISNVSGIPVDLFVNAGYTSLGLMRRASDEELSTKLGITPEQVETLRSGINFLSPIVGHREQAPVHKQAPQQQKNRGELPSYLTEEPPYEENYVPAEDFEPYQAPVEEQVMQDVGLYPPSDPKQPQE